jgi:hypothetical protein
MATRLLRNGTIWYGVMNGKVVKADDITKRMAELKGGEE